MRLVFMYFISLFWLPTLIISFSLYFYDTKIIELRSSFVQKISSCLDEIIKLSLYFRVARCVAKNEWSHFFWSPLSLDARISHNGKSFSFSTYKNCYFLIYLIFVAHEQKFMLFLCVFVSSKKRWLFFFCETHSIFFMLSDFFLQTEAFLSDRCHKYSQSWLSLYQKEEYVSCATCWVFLL